MWMVVVDGRLVQREQRRKKLLSFDRRNGMNTVTGVGALDVGQLWIPGDSGGSSKDPISPQLSAYRVGSVQVYGDFETQFDDCRVGRCESGFPGFSLSEPLFNASLRIFVTHEG